MIQIFSWILFYLVFLCFFVFLEEIDIKVEQNYIFRHLAIFLTKIGYKTLIRLTSSR